MPRHKLGTVLLLAAAVTVWSPGELAQWPVAAAFATALAPPGRTGAYAGARSLCYGTALLLAPLAGTALYRLSPPLVASFLLAPGLPGVTTQLVSPPGSAHLAAGPGATGRLRNCSIAVAAAILQFPATGRRRWVQAFKTAPAQGGDRTKGDARKAESPESSGCLGRRAGPMLGDQPIDAVGVVARNVMTSPSAPCRWRHGQDGASSNNRSHATFTPANTRMVSSTASTRTGTA